MSKFRRITLGALLLAVVGALLVFQFAGMRRLQSEKAGRREMTAQIDKLREENSRLLETQGDRDELERLRQEQSELLRLRAEVAQLRQRIRETSVKHAAPPLKEAPAATDEQPVSPIDSYVANIRATVAPKQTLVAGGWAMQSGKRTLMLVEPDITENEPRQISFQARFIEMSEEVLTRIGLEGIKSENKQSSAQAVLTPEQTAALMATLESTAGVDILSVPRLTTLDGRQAQVKAVNLKTIAGETYEIGPSVDIVSHTSADGASIDLSVQAQFRIPATPSP